MHYCCYNAINDSGRYQRLDMKIAIAIIMDKREIWGYRIFDTNMYKTYDLSRDDIHKHLYKYPQEYVNIHLDVDNKVEISSGNLDDYSKIDKNNYLLNNKSFIIVEVNKNNILKGIRYYVCFYDGKTDILSRFELLKLIKMGYTAANANIQGFMISSCSGSFINIKIDQSRINEENMKSLDASSMKYLAED